VTSALFTPTVLRLASRRSHRHGNLVVSVEFVCADLDELACLTDEPAGWQSNAYNYQQSVTGNRTSITIGRVLSVVNP
jgi:hypothetical protein